MVLNLESGYQDTESLVTGLGTPGGLSVGEKKEGNWGPGRVQKGQPHKNYWMSDIKF